MSEGVIREGRALKGSRQLQKARKGNVQPQSEVGSRISISPPSERERERVRWPTWWHRSSWSLSSLPHPGKREAFRGGNLILLEGTSCSGELLRTWNLKTSRILTSKKRTLPDLLTLLEVAAFWDQGPSTRLEEAVYWDQDLLTYLQIACEIHIVNGDCKPINYRALKTELAPQVRPKLDQMTRWQLGASLNKGWIFLSLSS